MKRLLKKLQQDKYLKDLDVAEFSRRVAFYLSEINMIHPFREGNGRTIREFIRRLAKMNGFLIDWSLIDNETLLKATIMAVDKDINVLAECIFHAIENK